MKPQQKTQQWPTSWMVSMRLEVVPGGSGWHWWISHDLTWFDMVYIQYGFDMI